MNLVRHIIEREGRRTAEQLRDQIRRYMLGVAQNHAQPGELVSVSLSGRRPDRVILDDPLTIEPKTSCGGHDIALPTLACRRCGMTAKTIRERDTICPGQLLLPTL